MRTIGLSTRSIVYATAGIVAVALVWAAVALVAPTIKVPSPVDVFEAARANWAVMPALSHFTFTPGGFQDALIYTAMNVLVAVAVGGLIGTPLGILVGKVRAVELLANPLLRVMGTVPLLILLPFVTLWFGTARFAQSALVLVFTVLTVTFAVQSAAATVSDHYSNYAACLGASRARVLWTVVLPATVPDLVGALRIALAAGWGWQCVAELLGAQAGVGRVIQVSGQTYLTDVLIAIMLCIAVMAVVVDALVAAIGRFATRWQEV